MGISGAYNVTTNDWTISGWIKTNITGPWVIFANGSNGIANPNDPDLPGGIRTNLWNEGTDPVLGSPLTMISIVMTYSALTFPLQTTGLGITWPPYAKPVISTSISTAPWTSRQWCPDTI